MSWTAVAGATNYTLTIGDTEFKTVTGTSVDIATGDYAKALKKGDNVITLKVNTTDDHLESPASDAVTYVLKVAFSALEITLTGSKVTWTASAEATSYTVTIGDKTVSVTEAEIDLEDHADKLVHGDNTVSVVVNAAGNNLESPASNTVTYGHDLRPEIANGTKNRHYREQYYLTRNCENYPAHELGPIAKILNINHGNRMVSLSCVASCAKGLADYVKRGKPHDGNAERPFRQADVVVALITCENGELIQIKLDTTLPRSYHREFMVAVRAGGTPSSMTKCFSMATTSF